MPGRNEEYLGHAIQHTTQVFLVGLLLRFVPELLKP